MRESDIVYENGNFWVCRGKHDYTVYRAGITHSTSDSAYAKTPDGLTVAIARCNYLAKRAGTVSDGMGGIYRPGVILSVG